MRAALFAFGAAVAVAFWPGALEAAFILRWALLALVPPLLFLLWHVPIPAPLRGFGTVLLIFPVLSVAWTPDRLLGAEEAIHLVILAGVFCLGAAVTDLKPLWRGLAAGVAVSGLLAVAQRYAGFSLIEQAVVPAGLFVNKNVLAEAGMVALIPMVLMRHWALAAGALLCVVMGDSRAATGALCVVWALWLLPRDRLAAAALSAVVVATAGMAFYVGDGSAAVRLGFWSDALTGLSLWGHGIGSYTAAFPFAEYAHSEPLQMIYELGAVYTLAVAALLIYLWMEPTHEIARLSCAGIAACGALSFPLHMPLTAFAFALAAGHVAAARAQLRLAANDTDGSDEHADGRPPAYAGAGRG